ncbi:hypothetical protein [Chromatocurvus halotolerans]|uniref:Uncharacterized protein n=1 Tax=Chromatocurvus halotolerans TaxID=1132028 RepID=A0A4R2KI83_9GAMM|nr:hypothetical protein [Chromatocurvus halotolerans]TCO69708.1 hypothetical protein EV688_1302 [Chromatocurvus halotolerans]
MSDQGEAKTKPDTSETKVAEESEPSEAVEESEPSEVAEAIGVKEVIETFLHRILDIEDCAKEYLFAAVKAYNDNAEKLTEDIERHQGALEDEKDETVRVLTLKELRKTLREIERHNKSSRVTTLEKSLFINLFSVFDKFVGDLVAVLYGKQPDLYKNINKEISLSEALKYGSMEELRQVFLDREIESIRRKSYLEQFKDLENKFSIKLTQFPEWPIFIERAQRRNLFTHCDGIVSKQYLDSCREAGCQLKGDVALGDQLKIGPKYLFESCRLICQVGIMLGQTLWRKTQEDDLEKADSHLSSIVFNYLHMEHWGKAISISKFAQALPKISTDEIERIFSVNHAIALCAIDKRKEAKAILDMKDWSATTHDFKLAYAILTDDYAKAEEIMCKLGKKGELINEISYHDWPLFREFRDSKEFFSAYEKVYGYKYSSKLSEIAETKKSEVEHRKDSANEE